MFNYTDFMNVKYVYEHVQYFLTDYIYITLFYISKLTKKNQILKKKK